MPSGQETDWAYSITTVPGTYTGQTSVYTIKMFINQSQVIDSKKLVPYGH